MGLTTREMTQNHEGRERKSDRTLVKQVRIKFPKRMIRTGMQSHAAVSREFHSFQSNRTLYSLLFFPSIISSYTKFNYTTLMSL